ncbi:MAG TPA: HIT domain-containing protein [Kofleriaceae bacterium]|nr:HIT domain-containing protein [Kofleriaceae bacterium]
MKHPSFSATCGVCQSLYGDAPAAAIYEDDLWHVRHAEPAGVPGWMLLITKRHVGGPAHFDDGEARAFGPALRHFERVLEQVTGALRIYTAAMGESHPHFHAHMVPRYATMPREAKAWSVFDLQRAVGAGEVAVDLGEVARVTEAYRRALAETPPPR